MMAVGSEWLVEDAFLVLTSTGYKRCYVISSARLFHRKFQSHTFHSLFCNLFVENKNITIYKATLIMNIFLN